MSSVTHETILENEWTSNIKMSLSLCHLSGPKRRSAGMYHHSCMRNQMSIISFIVEQSW